MKLFLLLDSFITKILRQFYETQFCQGFLLKNLRPLSPSPISMLRVSNLYTARSRCNLQTHQHRLKGGKPMQKVVVSIYFVTGCQKIRKSIMAGVTLLFDLSSGFCLMVGYLRAVKIVCIQVSQFEGIKDLLRFKIYCSFQKDMICKMHYILTYLLKLTIINECN